MPIAVCISTFGSANGTLFVGGRYIYGHFLNPIQASDPIQTDSVQSCLNHYTPQLNPSVKCYGWKLCCSTAIPSIWFQSISIDLNCYQRSDVYAFQGSKGSWIFSRNFSVLLPLLLLNISAGFLKIRGHQWKFEMKTIIVSLGCVMWPVERAIWSTSSLTFTSEGWLRLRHFYSTSVSSCFEISPLLS